MSVLRQSPRPLPRPTIEHRIGGSVDIVGLRKRGWVERSRGQRHPGSRGVLYRLTPKGRGILQDCQVREIDRVTTGRAGTSAQLG